MGVTGCFNSAWKTKLLIAETATWQALCGVLNPADQIAIYMGAEKDIPFPRCIINDASEGGSIEFTRAALSNWNIAATIMATFEVEVPDSANANTYEEEGNWFVSQTGAIVEEIQALVAPPLSVVGGENTVSMTSIATVEGPTRLAWEERDTYDLLPISGTDQYPLWIQTIQFMIGP